MHSENLSPSNVLNLMKVKFSISFFFSCALMGLFLDSCSNNERQVVPCDIDTDEILKPLQPNEDDGPENLTFGEKHIPGFVFDNEFTTDNNDVYVYLQNFTLLDVNPAINQSLMDFIVSNLAEYGFINDSISVTSNEFDRLQASGLSYFDAAGKVLDNIQNAFDAQLETIKSYDSPFNIYFQINPVFLDNRFVTYKESAYIYTGGAHGMTVTYLKTYSLESGKNLDFNDIVKPNCRSMVREEVAAQMAYSYPIYENITTVSQYIDSLNVWLDNSNESDGSGKITASDFPVSDVALVEQGLVFVYEMYELTPGSDGCPIVVIPYSAIRGALDDSIGK